MFVTCWKSEETPAQRNQSEIIGLMCRCGRTQVWQDADWKVACDSGLRSGGFWRVSPLKDNTHKRLLLSFSSSFFKTAFNESVHFWHPCECIHYQGLHLFRDLFCLIIMGAAMEHHGSCQHWLNKNHSQSFSSQFMIYFVKNWGLKATKSQMKSVAILTMSVMLWT